MSTVALVMLKTKPKVSPENHSSCLAIRLCMEDDHILKDVHGIGEDEMFSLLINKEIGILALVFSC